MNWLNKIDRIVVLNLPKREDRLLDFTGMMEEYEIPFERFSAIENSQGAEGLKDSMIEVFNQSISKGCENTLVFEDDAEIKVGKEFFHLTMDKVIETLPELYLMVSLGGQITGKVSHFHSTNIIQASKVYSTHAILYSNQGMKEILAQGITAPIDNFYVDRIECMRRSYMTYPLLVSQRPGFSDIGQNEISWIPFIDQKYEQQLQAFQR